MNRNRKRRYPRQTDIAVKKPITVVGQQGVFINIENGQFSLTDKNGHRYVEEDVEIETSFQGEKKRRIVQNAVGLPGGVNSVGEILKNFDIVYASDTNTKLMPDGITRCSAGVAFKGEICQTSEQGGTLTCRPYRLIRWVWNAEAKIENITWKGIIQEIQKDEQSTKRIGLVVDSDLGNLEAYNNRTLPLTEDFYLPENFSLLYASADYTDEWSNKMIRMCDREAAGQLKKYYKELLAKGAMSVPQGAIQGVMTQLVEAAAK